MINNNQFMVPDYKESFEEVMSHLKNRQGLLWKRTAYIAGPFLIAVALIYSIYRLWELGIIAGVEANLS